MSTLTETEVSALPVTYEYYEDDDVSGHTDYTPESWSRKSTVGKEFDKLQVQRLLSLINEKGIPQGILISESVILSRVLPRDYRIIVYYENGKSIILSHQTGH